VKILKKYTIIIHNEITNEITEMISSEMTTYFRVKLNYDIAHT
jgi:hypothetical protein